MSNWPGLVIAFLGGGLAGSLVTRYFALRDRAIKKLRLKVVREEVRSIIPVRVNEIEVSNLIYKKFTLINSTGKDFESLDVVFEFDKGSQIISRDVVSKKHGRNRFETSERKPSELVYHIRNFHRNHEIDFEFQVGNISSNNFCAVVDNCGVEIVVVRASAADRPSFGPARIVDKLDLE